MISKDGKVIETLFNIQNKQGKKVPFVLNEAQLFTDDIVDKYNNCIIAKARQPGFSSYVSARWSVKCLGYEGTRAVCISHEAGATQRLLDRVHYYMKHIKGPQPDFGRHSRSELYFNKTDSSFYIGTAGAKAFGRGDTVTHLHCSEYGWWEHAEQHQTGVFQAVPITGNIIIESTGNGRANDFYYMWKNAHNLGYERIFWPWFASHEYELDCLNWTPDCGEHNDWLLELQNKHKLSGRKMKWYEHKFKSLREDLRLMNQEYPSEPNDCFQSTGGGLFPGVVHVTNPLFITTKEYGYYCNKLSGHPLPGFTYVFGCDPSGGTGNDDAAIIGFCNETGEQVFEFASNTIQPIACGEFLVKIGLIYNEAYLIPEANNHGVALVEYLTKHYNRSKIYRWRQATKTMPAKYGWLNTRNSKHQLVDTMQVELLNCTLYGIQTVSELDAFEESEDGKMAGKSDNLVIACGLGILGLIRFSSRRGVHLVPVSEPKIITKANYMTFTLEDALSRIDAKGRGSYG